MSTMHLADEHATAELGRALAATLLGGDIVTIDGQLGAGKTTLVRAMAQAMGVPTLEIGSPSFGLAHEHTTASGGRLLHLDAYRLSGADDLSVLGWDEWLRDPACIICMEWSACVQPLPGRDATIAITLWHVASGRDVEVVWADAQRASDFAWPVSGATP